MSFNSLQVDSVTRSHIQRLVHKFAIIAWTGQWCVTRWLEWWSEFCDVTSWRRDVMMTSRRDDMPRDATCHVTTCHVTTCHVTICHDMTLSCRGISSRKYKSKWGEEAFLKIVLWHRWDITFFSLINWKIEILYFVIHNIHAVFRQLTIAPTVAGS